MVRIKESTTTYDLTQRMENLIIRFVRIVGKDWLVEKNNLRLYRFLIILHKLFLSIANDLYLYITILIKKGVLIRFYVKNRVLCNMAFGNLGCEIRVGFIAIYSCRQG